MTNFIERQTLISFLFDLWHGTRDRRALSILLAVCGTETI